jgi:hypothetical protein
MMHRRSFLRVTALSWLGAAATATATQRTAAQPSTRASATAGAQTSATSAPLLKMYKSPT